MASSPCSPGDRPVGVLSERDIVHRVVDRGLDPACTLVADVMTTDLLVAQADDDYRSAMRAVDQANIRHLPVLSGDRLHTHLVAEKWSGTIDAEHDARDRR